MAGGTWIVQNKTRPGAYINFKAVSPTDTGIASRGVATMPLVMDWGREGEVIEILSADFAAGKSLAQIGYDPTAPQALLFRECLKNCYKLLAYRVNSGGEEATAVLGDLTVEAQYPGIKGNGISVAVLEASGGFDVVTYLSSQEVNRQRVASIDALVSMIGWSSVAPVL